MSDGVGNIEVLGRYPDFATGSKAAVAIAADPDSIALLAERENPIEHSARTLCLPRCLW